MGVTPELLIGQKSDSDDVYRNVVYVRSYAECAGVLAAHKVRT
jgi:hypothetical protein